MTERLTEKLEREWETHLGSETETDPTELAYADRVAYWRTRLPESYADSYDRLLGLNCAPRTAAGVCHYVAGLDGNAEPRTQAEIAAEYGISTPTIRKWYPTVTDQSIK